MNTTNLIHQVQEPAQTVHIIPGLQNSSLLSISKFADANYRTKFTPSEVKIFDGDNTKISSTGELTLQGNTTAGTPPANKMVISSYRMALTVFLSYQASNK